jgi:histidine triad (HIT) family protein
MEGCIFCKITKKQIPAYIVFENKDFLAFLDLNPISKGHTLLIPKKHIGYVFEAKEPLYSNIFKTIKKLAAPLQKMTKAKRIGLAIEGFGVGHVHVHLVPVNKGNDLNPEGETCRSKRACTDYSTVQKVLISRFGLSQYRSKAVHSRAPV